MELTIVLCSRTALMRSNIWKAFCQFSLFWVMSLLYSMTLAHIGRRSALARRTTWPNEFQILRMLVIYIHDNSGWYRMIVMIHDTYGCGPPPSNSDHQNYYIITYLVGDSDSYKSPFVILLGGGPHPTYIHESISGQSRISFQFHLKLMKLNEFELIRTSIPCEVFWGCYSSQGPRRYG